MISPQKRRRLAVKFRRFQEWDAEQRSIVRMKAQNETIEHSCYGRITVMPLWSAVTMEDFGLEDFSNEGVSR